MDTNTIKLTTEQFDNLLKTLPIEDFDYQASGEPVRGTATFEGKIVGPRYFEHKGKCYLEVL